MNFKVGDRIILEENYDTLYRNVAGKEGMICDIYWGEISQKLIYEILLKDSKKVSLYSNSLKKITSFVITFAI